MSPAPMTWQTCRRDSETRSSSLTPPGHRRRTRAACPPSSRTSAGIRLRHPPRAASAGPPSSCPAPSTRPARRAPAQSLDTSSVMSEPRGSRRTRRPRRVRFQSTSPDSDAMAGPSTAAIFKGAFLRRTTARAWWTGFLSRGGCEDCHARSQVRGRGHSWATCFRNTIAGCVGELLLKWLKLAAHPAALPKTAMLNPTARFKEYRRRGLLAVSLGTSSC